MASKNRVLIVDDEMIIREVLLERSPRSSTSATAPRTPPKP